MDVCLAGVLPLEVLVRDVSVLHRGWTSGRTSINVQIMLWPSAADAARSATPDGASPSAQSVAGLGDSAVAYLTTSGDISMASLTVQSGNAVIDLSYSSPAGSRSVLAERSAACCR